MDRVRLFKSLERTIARSEDVDQILRRHVSVIASSARARLAAVREQTPKGARHEITVNKGAVDHYVNLEGPAPMSLEAGFHHPQSKEYVPGKNVLRGSIS